MALPMTPTESRNATKAAARAAAWGVAVYTAVKFIGILFASASMAAAVGQAIAAEFGAGRVGVAWSDPHEPLPTTAAMARRAGIGAAVGAATALVVLAFAWGTRAAIFDRPESTP